MQEFGEGIDRMYREMEKAGLPAPEYKDVAFMLNATIRNGINVVESVADNVADAIKLSSTEQAILNYLELSAKELGHIPVREVPQLYCGYV